MEVVNSSHLIGPAGMLVNDAVRSACNVSPKTRGYSEKWDIVQHNYIIARKKYCYVQAQFHY